MWRGLVTEWGPEWGPGVYVIGEGRGGGGQMCEITRER